MVEQVIRPQAVVKKRYVVPREHQYHARHELAVPQRQREHLIEAQLFAHRIRVFAGAGLHAHVYQHEQERRVAQPDNQLLLIGRARHRVGQKARGQQHHAGHYRAEHLVERYVAYARGVLSRVEVVEPGRKARAEERVDGMGNKQYRPEPNNALMRVGHEVGHGRGGQYVQGVEEYLGGEQYGLAPLYALQYHRGKHAEAAGYQRYEADYAHLGDGYIVYRQKAGIEYASYEHIIKRGKQSAAQAYEAALGIVVAQVVYLAQAARHPSQINMLHIPFTHTCGFVGDYFTLAL